MPTKQAEPVTIYYDRDDQKGVSERFDTIINWSAGDAHRVVVLDTPIVSEGWDRHPAFYIYLLFSPNGPGSYDVVEGWATDDFQEAKLFAAHLAGTLRGHNLPPVSVP